MARFNPIYLLLALAIACGTASCNKDTDQTEELSTNANTIVSSFKLGRNEKILTNLDSVFFSIDLEKAEIYNADSLPKGTDVRKITIAVGTSSASECNVTYRVLGTDRDTTVNIVKSPNDSINFTAGPVKMEVVSYNTQMRRTYTVHVNVHQSNPDSLYWNELANHTLPTSLDAPTAQKTVSYLGQARVYTIDASGKGNMAVCDNPYDAPWHNSAVNFPTGARIETITTSGIDALYMLNSSDELYASDGSQEWTPTGSFMSHIYGIFNGKVIGAIQTPAGWKGVTYPGNDTFEIPAEMPIDGTSSAYTFDSQWSISPLMIFFGGRAADGKLSGDSWAFDGAKWTKLSLTPTTPCSGAALVPYFVPETNTTTWTVSSQPVLLAFGGNVQISNQTAPSKNVYISYDLGMRWKLADNSLQFPDFIPQFTDAQALKFDATMYAAGSRSGADSGWTRMGKSTIPVWATPAPLPAASRASKPVTEWATPYIYLFGGCDAYGKLRPTMWRGVINYYTFKPLY